MLDSILNLRLAGMAQRELLKEAEGVSEARQSPPTKSKVSSPNEFWPARSGGKLITIGMRLKARSDQRYSKSGLNVA